MTSIWSNDTFYKGATSYPVTDFKYYTAEFCNFEKNISSDNSKMSYHLSGYGVLHNEAYSSFIGESSERYTFASIYRLLKDKVEIGSYIYIWLKNMVKIVYVILNCLIAFFTNRYSTLFRKRL